MTSQWQQDPPGLCTMCRGAAPYWGAVCQACGVAAGVGGWGDPPNQPQPDLWWWHAGGGYVMREASDGTRRLYAPGHPAIPVHVSEEAQPVGLVQAAGPLTEQDMTDMTQQLQYLAWRWGRRGGNTTFHTGGVVTTAAGGGAGGTGTTTVRVRCSLCGGSWAPDLTIGGCPHCHGDPVAAAAYAKAHSDACRRCGRPAPAGRVTPGWSYLCGDCTAETTPVTTVQALAGEIRHLQDQAITVDMARVQAQYPPPPPARRSPAATISGLAARVGVLTGLVLLLNLAVMVVFAHSLAWLGEADGLVLVTAGAFMGWAGIARHGKDTP